MATFLTFQLTPLALPQAIAFVLCVMAAGFVWPLRRESVSASWLLLVLICAAWWALTGALEFSAGTLRAKIFWTQVSYIGIVLSPVALFHFSYAFTHGGARPPRLGTILMTGLGLAILTSVWTNSWHGRHWPAVTEVHHDDLFFARYERGPMFWVTVIYCYGFMLASSVILASHTLSMGRIFRQQGIIIILATLAPWITSLCYVLRIGPMPELDHTPVGFAVTGMLLTWAVMRVRLFELVPVAANTLFTRIPDPVLVSDPAGRLVRANAAALGRFPEIVGYIGEPLALSLGRHPALVAILAENEASHWKKVLPLGSVWWSVESTSLDESVGGSRGRLIVLRDISEQKRVELELIEAKQEVEQALARADLHARDAVAANAAKSTFLAQVSHDLRTPLHAILGMTEVLRAGSLDTAQRMEVATISDAGDALLRLINDLLDLSRIEAGRIDLAHEPFQLDDILDQLADLLGMAACRKGLSFTYWIEPGLLGGLRGDADRLRQILFNLVGNAVKFTEQGGVIVRAGRSPAGSLRIEVEDTGRGISPEHLPALFDPFNRGDPETARRAEGTGLGLAITRRLANAMGGDVAVRSPPGSGAVFSLELPLIDDSAVNAGFTRLAGHVRGRRFAVALKDPLRRKAVVNGLQSLGAVVDLIDEDAAPDPGADALVIEAADRRWPVPTEWSSRGRLLIALTAPGTKAGGSTTALRRRNLAAALLPTISAPQETRMPVPAVRWRVLLADDNELSRRVSAAQLGQCGCAVDTVAGGLAALARLATERYDLVVLDGQMPDLNGWEVTERLRQGLFDAPNARTPVIALTADLSADMHARWLGAGAGLVLGKPVRTRDLAAAVAKLLEKTEAL